MTDDPLADPFAAPNAAPSSDDEDRGAVVDPLALALAGAASLCLAALILAVQALDVASAPTPGIVWIARVLVFLLPATGLGLTGLAACRSAWLGLRAPTQKALRALTLTWRLLGLTAVVAALGSSVALAVLAVAVATGRVPVP